MNKGNENLIERPPVVVVMGHIDHGKTKLLDAIRKTKVVEQEKGGITQSIGAYEVSQKGKKITFIDTPGHQNFIGMRRYGAKVADLAILVVAADEGPKEQTWESYKIIKEANLPFIVAINKIDKPEAEIERTKNQLADRGILLENYGGDIPYQEISAKERVGIDELLDLILLVAEMLELKADPEAMPSGFVLESHLEAKKGKSASLIIKEGTLFKNQYIKTNSAKGKIKIMENFLREVIEKVGPSTPVLVIGFDRLPKIGENFIASFSKEELEKIELPKKREDGSKLKEEERSKEEVKLILKARTDGSLMALEKTVKEVGEKNGIRIIVVKKGVGEISEEDGKMGESTGAIIIGFGVKETPGLDFFLKEKNIKVIKDEIIYDLEEKLEEEIEKRMREKEEIYSGILEVLAIFRREKNEQLIGGRVEKGEIKNKQRFEIFKGEEKVGFGLLKNIRKGKNDVSLVKENEECGLLVESKKEIEKGDVLKFLK